MKNLLKKFFKSSTTTTKQIFSQIVSPPSKIFPRIGIINQSTVLTDAQIILAMEAIQIQIDRDFGPIWDLYAKLEFYNKTSTIPNNIWRVYILDSSDIKGALGYHEVDSSGILPIAKIFAKDDIDNNLNWSVTLSHEILEQILDPDTNLSVFVQTSQTEGKLFAYEVADAVQDDTLGYLINNIKVSDFVTPQWFNVRCQPNSAQFDFCNKVHSPLTLWMGGYIATFDVGPDSKGWTQIFAESHPPKRVLVKKENSRFYKRKNRIQ